MTERCKNKNAVNAPKLTSEARLSMVEAKMVVTINEMMATRMVLAYGVLNLGCTLDKMPGSFLSRAML